MLSLIIFLEAMTPSHAIPYRNSMALKEHLGRIKLIIWKEKHADKICQSYYRAYFENIFWIDDGYVYKDLELHEVPVEAFEAEIRSRPKFRGTTQCSFKCRDTRNFAELQLERGHRQVRDHADFQLICDSDHPVQTEHVISKFQYIDEKDINEEGESPWFYVLEPIVDYTPIYHVEVHGKPREDDKCYCLSSEGSDEEVTSTSNQDHGIPSTPMTASQAEPGPSHATEQIELTDADIQETLEFLYQLEDDVSGSPMKRHKQ
ncbi:hypothetical protein MRB53_040901 [Persea americana]|nr:hypothetical protein MRB53_040901 [Persea americana]